MKNLLILVIVLMTLWNTNTNAQTGVYCPSYIQEQTQWCWAASTQMVYWNYGSGTINQCDAVNVSKWNEFWGGCGNLDNSWTSACSNPSKYNNPQAMYGCGGSLQSTLSDYGIASTAYGSNLSASTVAANTKARKLMIARWGWNNGGGHFVVINRYKNGFVYFNDPWSGSAIWSYNTFNTANGQGSWTHTLRMNSATVYGSTLYRTANSSGSYDEDSKQYRAPNSSASYDSKQYKTANPKDSKADFTTEFSINLYPNPATEKVNILLNGEKNNDNQILITDVTGKVVFKQVYSKETPSVLLDVDSWNRGIYLVTANNNLSKKLILR